MNARIPVLICLVVLGSAGPAAAELCTPDSVPAATLLLPYFEVGLTPRDADPVAATRTVDTFFSVHNATATPTVAHVVMWGDWSLPSIDFDIFLTGYDVETVSLSEVFNWGNLPVTSHAWNDPEDTISPHGRLLNDPANASGPHPGNSENPQWDSELQPGVSTGCDPMVDPTCPRFPGCDTNLPLSEQAYGQLTESLFQRIRCGHTGRGLACQSQSCIGQPHDETGTGGNDYIARGYLTIDNVNDCNLLFPAQEGYFSDPGIVSYENQLWGDWFIVQEGRAIGDQLVAIEADPTGTVFGPGDATFYARFVDGLATDQREPLGSTWAVRYFQPSATFTGGTSLFVWRDSKCDVSISGFGNGCVPSGADGVPPWYPLDETQIVAFDTQEDASEICASLTTPGGGGVSPPDPDITTNATCFPLETGRYRIDEDDLEAIPYDFGWIYLNLNFTLGDTSGSPTPCTTDGLLDDVAQSWVSVELDSEGVSSVGFAATQLTSACEPSNPLIPLQ